MKSNSFLYESQLIMWTKSKSIRSVRRYRILFFFLFALLATKNSYAQCGQISSGASGVGLQGTSSCASYTLYRSNGTPAGSEQPGGGGAITWSVGAGTYYAKRTSGTCCVGWESSPVTVSGPPACGSISISPAHEPKVCVGGTIRLTPIGGSNYSWTTDNYDPHATGSTYIDATPSVTTIYTLHGTESVCNTPQTFQLQVVVGGPKVGQVTLTNQGPNSWCQGAVASTLFTASAANAYVYIWSVPSEAGTASLNADETQCTVTWNSTYNGSFNVGVTAYSNGCPDYTNASIPFTINPLPGPPTGLGPTTALYNSSVPLTASGAITNEVYRWRDDSGYFCQGGSGACSTPVLYSAPSFTYYATKYNTATTCETPPSQRVPLAISLYLNPPTTPIVTANTCGPKTVIGFAPDKVTYYLQTDPSGRSTDKPISSGGAPITSSGSYWVNASANTITLWSSSSVALSQTTTTINPVDLVLTSYDLSGFNTLVQATHSIILKPGFYVSSGNLLDAKITISPECNSLYNWEEGIAYNETGAVVADSRRYYDGLGITLENETKNISQGLVFANQTIKDSFVNPSLVTLPAPILENDFIFKDALLFNASGQPYSSADFDGGNLNTPNAVGTSQAGSVGNYYSSANTVEPNTPTTSYPYSNSYTPPGPNPPSSKSSGPGDAYKMGSGHEVKSDKTKFTAADIPHYYSLRPYFSTFPYYTITNPLAGGYTLTPYQSATTGTSTVYTTITSTTATGNPGVYPINGSIPVTPGTICNFSMVGYKTGNGYAQLHVTDGAGTDLGWSSNYISQVEGTTTVTYTVPSTGVTSIKLGIQWTGPVIGEIIYMKDITLQTQVPSNLPAGNTGYKIVSTDPDGKMTASFTDADGNTLASVLVTSVTGTTYTYDNTTWSYNYYNDIGQLVASVAPNGIAVNGTLVGTSTMPNFVTTYRYDNLGRLIETTSPDEGTSQFVYSTDGKIRFSQNQEQRSPATNKRFSYTNYDYLGRLIESGEYTYSTTGDFVFDPAYTTTPSANSVLNIVDNVGYTGVTGFTGDTHCTDVTFIQYDTQASDFVSDGNHITQNNLIGQVSRTKNANATTWYSYDEFGHVEWTMQNIVGLGNKTVDYTYDFLGNVTQVAYQNSSGPPADRFYHHYTYDADSKLTDVATSFDGTTKTAQAKYKYYLHGPLKRVELASSLQGIDYVYTINGALKGINHADVSNDPGHDGSNGFSTDVFGETLNYFSNDYTGAGYSAGSFSGGLTNYYGGQINSTSWFTPVDNGTTNKKVYGYSYDNLNRFTNAQFGTVGGSLPSYSTALSPTNYNENVTGYDNNGNISALSRKDKNGGTLGSYTYNYTPNTNKLSSITGNTTVNYTYNNIGQMTQQTEGSKTMIVAYNAYGLTKEVRDGSNNLTEQYFYDDRGDLVKKLYYNAGALFKTAYFVHDASGNVLATYEQNTGGSLALIELPIYGSGRLGMVKIKSGQPKYFYEMKDHLGNVRTVIGSPYQDNFLATMEPANAPTETKQFVDITSTAIPYSSANTTAGGSYVSRLNALQNGNTAPHIVGPGIVLAVSPGDVISASVYGYYEGGYGFGPNNLPVATVTAALVAALSGVTPGDPGVLSSSMNSAYQGPFATELTNSTAAVPHAYLNMIQFDGYLNFDSSLPSQAIAYSNPTPGTKQQISFQGVPITKPGYVYIWVDVTGNSSNYMYFDDLSVSQLHSPYVAGGDFYPFGLTMDDRQIKSERYRYGYQGQFSEYDSLTKTNQFQLRLYDPRFGRWTSPDPYGQYSSPYVAMGNNPVSGADPDGGFCCAGIAEEFAELGEMGMRDAVLLNESMLSSINVLGAASDLAAFSKGGIGATNAAGRLSGGAAIEYNIAYEVDGELASVRHFPTPNLDIDYDFTAKLAQFEPRPMATGAIEPFTIGTPLNAVIETGANLFEGNFAAAGIAAIGIIPGARSLASLRQTAVRQAWKQEANLVRRGMQGTVRWSESEAQELLTRGKVSGYIGHHINSVKAFPHLAGNPNNIAFISRKIHLKIHGGNFRNPTGPLPLLGR